jgi:hypothetical protein
MDNFDNTDNENAIIFSKPEIKIINFNEENRDECIIYQKLCSFLEQVEFLEEKFKGITDNIVLNEENEENKSYIIDNPFKIIKKELNSLKDLLIELGLWSFKKAFQVSIKTITKKIILLKENINIQFIEALVNSLDTHFNYLFDKFIPYSDCIDNILKYSSIKVNCMIDIFKDAYLKCDSLRFYFL